MTLTTLNYNDRQLKELPSDTFSEHKNVQQILLYKNRLRSLPVNIFDGLEKLTHLDLSENCFFRIPAAAIAKAQNIQSLSFESNQVKRILKSDFENNYNLNTLLLSYNALNFIAVDAFKNQKYLRRLDLSFSSIGHQLEWPIFKSTVFLRQLLITDAQLKIGNDLFKGLFNLVGLYLNNNKISHNDLNVNVFGDLTSLKVLDLSQNRIHHLEKGLFDNMSHLVKINLSDNLVDRIDAEIFDRNPSLEFVGLLNCSTQLNVDFSLFQNNTLLYMLEISYCYQFPIHEIEHLTYLSYDSCLLLQNERQENGIPEMVLSNYADLECLRINDSFISIATFHEINSRFKKLHILNLKNCTIKELRNYLLKDLCNLETLIFDNVPFPSFKHVLFQERNKLKRLSLSNCGLTNITTKAFKNFFFLKTLNLSKNNFENQLSDQIFVNLLFLEKLDLSQSNVDYLPLTIFNTNLKLTSLRLHHNPLHFIELKIFEKNSKLAYLSVSEFTYLVGEYSTNLKIVFVTFRF